MGALHRCSAQRDRKMVKNGEDAVRAAIFPDDRQGSRELSRAVWRAGKKAAERWWNRSVALLHSLERVIP